MAEYLIQDTTANELITLAKEISKTTEKIKGADVVSKIREVMSRYLDTSIIEHWDYYNRENVRNETMDFIDCSNGISFEYFCYNAKLLSEKTFEFHWEKGEFFSYAFQYSDVLGLTIHFGEVESSSMISMFRNVTNLNRLIVSGKIKVVSNDLNFAYANLDVESLLSILNALDDNTGKDVTYNVTLGNNLSKLTEKEKQIAYNKNITLS